MTPYMIIMGIMGVFSAIITYFLVPYIKANTDILTQTKIEKVIRIAVEGFEQLYKSNPNFGAKKKEMVLEFLDKIGLKISDDELDKIIEAIVYEMNQNKTVG